MNHLTISAEDPAVVRSVLLPRFLEQALRDVPPIVRGWVSEAQIRLELESWLAQQLDRMEDPAWVARVRGPLAVDGFTPRDYLHRIVHVGPSQRLLAGIRFYFRRTDDPYVELLAWTDPLDARQAVEDAVEALLAAFSSFGPRAVCCLRAGHLLPVASAHRARSMWVIAGAVHEISAGPPPRHYPEVTLETWVDVDEALAFVEEAYRELADVQPVLAQEVLPATRSQLQACTASGHLYEVRIEGRRAGLLSAQYDELPFLKGYCIAEEILAAPFRGRGYAASAQRHLVDRIAALDPRAILFGTIHHHNVPSHATALRVGRHALGSYLFLEPPRRGALP